MCVSVCVCACVCRYVGMLVGLEKLLASLSVCLWPECRQAPFPDKTRPCPKHTICPCLHCIPVPHLHLSSPLTPRSICSSVSRSPDQHTCPADRFKCQNNRCISLRWLCDGDNDCGNDEDESNTTCSGKPRTHTHTHTYYFTLSSKPTVDRNWISAFPKNIYSKGYKGLKI